MIKKINNHLDVNLFFKTSNLVPIHIKYFDMTFFGEKSSKPKY